MSASLHGPFDSQSTSPSRTVGVVITTYNDAQFLVEALRSVCTQTRVADAIIVVDDGSRGDPTAITEAFPAVQLIRQSNAGLAAARNTGLAAVATAYVVFLDADDCLEPEALDAGLACFRNAPDCGFVYGGHRSIDPNGAPLGESFQAVYQDPYEQLLRSNFVAMHGAVMYRRDRVLAVGGFDERLRLCEDYDLYLRMARRYPVAAHPGIVAVYRRRPASLSSAPVAMLRATLAVHRRHRPGRRDPAYPAWADGQRFWRRYYAEVLAGVRYRTHREAGSVWRSALTLATIAAIRPAVAAREIARATRRRIRAAAGLLVTSARSEHQE